MFHLIFFLTMLSICLASDPNTIYKLRMYVTNAIGDNIVVHVSGSEDLGNRTLAFNQEFDWRFGVKLGTYYLGEFWWGSKHASVSLFNFHISRTCFNGKVFSIQRCYWLVKPDGFWYHEKNDTFPGEWTRRATW
ncbi:putative plant self-incompatibility S1 [Helianthus anomalus]